MMPRAFRRLGAALVVGGATLAAASLAQAQSVVAAGSEDRRQAAKDFADGDRAFKEGDYRQAAESYERAYARVPHPSALWNAARAWHRAGELARAANLYVRYLREAPAGARDRNTAQKAMNELSGRLARIEVHATDVGDVEVDGQALMGPSVFVTPGAHVVSGRAQDGRPVRQSQTVEAGDIVSVALVPPPAAGAPAPPSPQPSEKHASVAWSPIVVYFGGAVSLALAGITVWSGLDTLQQKDTFDRSPTQSNLDLGRQKETRTNVLIAAGAGVVALTVVTAVVLVDWHGSSERREPAAGVQVGAGIGSLVLQGSF
jgi:hypothetical protein